MASLAKAPSPGGFAAALSREGRGLIRAEVSP